MGCFPQVSCINFHYDFFVQLMLNSIHSAHRSNSDLKASLFYRLQQANANIPTILFRVSVTLVLFCNNFSFKLHLDAQSSNNLRKQRAKKWHATNKQYEDDGSLTCGACIEEIYFIGSHFYEFKLKQTGTIVSVGS